MDRRRVGIGIAWAATLVAAVAVGMRVPRASLLEALGIELAVAVVAGFALQLAAGGPDGIVQRLTASVCGSFLLVLLAALVFSVW